VPENTTYSEIQAHVRKKHGKVMKTCWIAHAKEVYGLNPKRSKQRTGNRLHPCPDDKLLWIKEAFTFFKMI
jgi:hypothetical protein